MARITPLTREQFDPELASRVEYIETDVELGNLRIFAHSPGISLAWMDFLQGVGSSTTLSRRLIEIVRLRIAFHNQCPHCMAIRFEDAFEDGFSEELVCSLEKPEEAPDLTEAERSALRYADAMATNHFEVSDQLFLDLKQHFNEREIVELGTNIAIFVGFGRLSYSWKLLDDLPSRYDIDKTQQLHFQDDGLVVQAHHN